MYFGVLARRLPGVAEVAVTPKRGRDDNELTRFRYDVTLRRVGPGCEPLEAKPARGAADGPARCALGPGLTVALVRRRLETGGEPALVIGAVPNARVAADVVAWERIAAAVDGAETAAALRAELTQTPPPGSIGGVVGAAR